MKNQLFVFVIAIAVSLNAYSQKKQAYCIAKNGEKIEGIVSPNIALFLNDPFAQIVFETEEKSKSISAGEIQEFGIVGETKHVRVDALINDFSLYSNYSSNPQVQLSKKSTILQVLLEGSVNLYVLPSENGDKFFYRDNNSKEAIQLIYNKFLNENGALKENKEYQKTLFDLFNCKGLAVTDFVKIRYKTADLIDFFTEYLVCKNEKPKTIYMPVIRKTTYSIAASAGMFFSNYGIENRDGLKINNPISSPSIGAEFEILFPKRTLALFFGVDYFRFNDEISVSYTKETNTTINNHLDRYSYRFPILLAQAGARLYLTPNRKIKFFIDGTMSAPFTRGKFTFSQTMSNAGGNYVYEPQTTQVEALGIPQIGFGAEYKNLFVKFEFSNPPGDIQRPIDNHIILIEKMFSTTLSYRFRL
jgi:hypothetical protein